VIVFQVVVWQGAGVGDVSNNGGDVWQAAGRGRGNEVNEDQWPPVEAGCSLPGDRQLASYSPAAGSKGSCHGNSAKLPVRL
jgi:hypothetical protein